MKEISEKEMVEAIEFAHEEIKHHCQVQLEMTKAVGKEEKERTPTKIMIKSLKKKC